MVFIKFHKHSKVSARILRFVIRQNEQDWILRCLCKPVMSSGGVRAAFLNKNIRKLMVILLRGSLASTEKKAQKVIWNGILYANGPKYVHEDGEAREGSDSEYDEYRPYVNPLWKLAWRPRKRLLKFLGDYQKRRRSA